MVGMGRADLAVHYTLLLSFLAAALIGLSSISMAAGGALDAVTALDAAGPLIAR